jgi:hypothetical protein
MTNRSGDTTGDADDRFTSRRFRDKETPMASPVTGIRRGAQDRKAPRNLVEKHWDPITRIVGSLGIFTKIDFENREVAECYSTSSIFRGYSIFMKGKDPRDSHFITSRILRNLRRQPRDVLGLRAEHGVRHQAPRDRRMDRQPRRGRRVHVRSQQSSRTTWWGSISAKRW